MTRQLRVGLGKSDRTQAVIDGRTQFRSVDGIVECPPHEELFRRAFDLESYDVAELSLSNFIVMTASGRCGYRALPIFTSRMFRHATILSGPTAVSWSRPTSEVKRSACANSRIPRR